MELKIFKDLKDGLYRIYDESYNIKSPAFNNLQEAEKTMKSMKENQPLKEEIKMEECIRKVMNYGHTTTVSIPKKLVLKLGLKAGDRIKLMVEKVAAEEVSNESNQEDEN